MNSSAVLFFRLWVFLKRSFLFPKIPFQLVFCCVRAFRFYHCTVELVFGLIRYGSGCGVSLLAHSERQFNSSHPFFNCCLSIDIPGQNLTKVLKRIGSINITILGWHCPGGIFDIYFHILCLFEGYLYLSFPRFSSWLLSALSLSPESLQRIDQTLIGLFLENATYRKLRIKKKILYGAFSGIWNTVQIL